MAESQYTGGSAGPYSFSFESYQVSDVKVSVDGVDKTVTTHYTISNYTTTGGGQVTFTSGNVPTGTQTIRIYRETDVAAIKATFAAGSSIKSEDLNNNFKQLRLSSGEVIGPNQISDGSITSVKIANNTIVDADVASNAELSVSKLQSGAARQLLQTDTAGTGVEFTSNVDVPGTLDVTGATTLDSGLSVTGNISTTGSISVSGTVDGRDVATDGTKLDTIESGATADQTAAEIRTLVESASDSNVFTDADHTKLDGIESGATADQTAAEIRTLVDNASDSNVYVDAHYNLVNGITATSAEINKLDGVTASTDELNVTDGITATTSEINILDGVTSNASELNTLDGITASTAELNQLDGKTISSTFTPANANDIPTSAAINTYFSGLINALGGFVAIDDENSFPTTNPDPSDNAGTIVSIANAGGMSINSSGVGTGQTTAGTAVTITGFPSTFNSTTIQDGLGLQVQTTSTLNTYTYHKVYAKDEDVRQLSQDVNDFKARYRVGASNPTTDLDSGDLFYNTGSGKMLVYNGLNSAWEEVQSIGEFFINTLSASTNTGGGSATFNGTAYRFTLSNAPTNAEQLLVSVNGVVQKPNSGTSQPSEGFAIDGSDIIFAAAPATSAPFFIITLGSAVNIGTPSAGTVGTAQLATSAVTNAKVSSSAAIAGTKISPDFGSQNIVTTGSAGIGTSSPTEPLSVSKAVTTSEDLFSLTGTSFGDGETIYQTFKRGSVHLAKIGVEAAGAGQSGELVFETTSSGTTSEALRIESSGNVGIGTPSASNDIHLKRTDSDAIIRIENTGNGNHSGIFFVREASSGTSKGAANIHVESNTGGTGTALIFGCGSNTSATGGERMRITSNGNVAIGTTTASTRLDVEGNGVPVEINSANSNSNKVQLSDAGTVRGYFGASSTASFLVSGNGGSEQIRVQATGGISFNGDTAAANALDDYEEGTWTPAIENTGYTYTYGYQEGTYTKIGRLVTLRWRLSVTARSGSGSGGHPIIRVPTVAAADGTLDSGNHNFAMPSELIVHKTSTTTSSGTKTLLFGGFANNATAYFWVNNPTTSQTTPFDLGSDFNLGGVITYTS